MRNPTPLPPLDTARLLLALPADMEVVAGGPGQLPDGADVYSVTISHRDAVTVAHLPLAIVEAATAARVDAVRVAIAAAEIAAADAAATESLRATLHETSPAWRIGSAFPARE